MSYPPLPQTQQPMPAGYQQPMMQMAAPQYQAGGEWAAPVATGQHAHPALAYLATVDHLFVKQQLEVLEMFTGFETQNKYKVKNAAGQTAFKAVEDNDCCTRNLCGPARPFTMRIMDNAGQEVISIERPLACDCCCFYPCSHQSLEVCCPPGNVVGKVDKDWSLITPKFSVQDASGNTVLRIVGPCCTFAMCGAIEFEVFSADGSTPVGKITKEWSGWGKELFADADNFGVSFPMDLAATVKATLLGAVFLIDFLYYEKKTDNS